MSTFNNVKAPANMKEKAEENLTTAIEIHAEAEAKYEAAKEEYVKAHDSMQVAKKELDALKTVQY